MLDRLPVDLIVEIGILAGPDEYEELAKTSERNAIIIRKPHITRATNAFIDKISFNLCSFEHFSFQGKLHSFNDHPAIIWDNGSKAWYHHGKLHRDNDKQAEVQKYLGKFWYRHGKLHRDNDQPAIIYRDQVKEWYQHGTLIK
jgi:antitoxin component YwqK of YwqJK toxin-antitoxin module